MDFFAATITELIIVVDEAVPSLEFSGLSSSQMLPETAADQKTERIFIWVESDT